MKNSINTISILKIILITVVIGIFTPHKSYAMEPEGTTLDVDAINTEALTTISIGSYADIVVSYLEQHILTPSSSSEQPPSTQTFASKHRELAQSIANILNAINISPKEVLLALSYLARVKTTHKIVNNEILHFFMAACHHAQKIMDVCGQNKNYDKEKWLTLIATYGICLVNFRKHLIAMYTALNFNLNTTAEVLRPIANVIIELA